MSMNLTLYGQILENPVSRNTKLHGVDTVEVRFRLRVNAPFFESQKDKAQTKNVAVLRARGVPAEMAREHLRAGDFVVVDVAMRAVEDGRTDEQFASAAFEKGLDASVCPVRLDALSIFRYAPLTERFTRNVVSISPRVERVRADMAALSEEEEKAKIREIIAGIASNQRISKDY
jgi:hypothetical protein